MNTELVAHWLIFAGLLWLSVRLHRHWVRLRHDRFRFRLFEVRDNLYNLAAAGGLSCSDKLFVEFRDRINAALRYSEDIGAQELVTSLATCKDEASAFGELLDRAPPSVKPELIKLTNSFVTAIVDILFFNSNFLKLARFLVALRKWWKGGNKNAESVVPKGLRKEPERVLPRPLREVPSVRAVRAIRTCYANFL